MVAGPIMGVIPSHTDWHNPSKFSRNGTSSHDYYALTVGADQDMLYEKLHQDANWRTFDTTATMIATTIMPLVRAFYPKFLTYKYTAAAHSPDNWKVTSADLNMLLGRVKRKFEAYRSTIDDVVL